MKTDFMPLLLNLRAQEASDATKINELMRELEQFEATEMDRNSIKVVDHRISVQNTIKKLQLDTRENFKVTIYDPK